MTLYSPPFFHTLARIRQPDWIRCDSTIILAVFYLSSLLALSDMIKMYGVQFVCKFLIPSSLGHVDLLWTRDDGIQIPIEIKTTNSKFIDGPSYLHRKQLLQYAAILDAPYGKLIYIFLDGKTENPFQEFLVAFEDYERAEILEKLEYDAVELTHGILAQDPSLVSHVANNPNFIGYNGKNWLCEKCCSYKNQCDAMRIAAGEQIKVPDVKAKSTSIEKLIGDIKCRQQ